MKRRTFISGMSFGLLAASRVAWGQQGAKAPRVGVIGEASRKDPMVAAFRQGMRERGYVEGQNVVIELRYARGALDRVPTLAAELLRLNVAVLVVGGTVVARSVKALTATVPIVFARASDPAGSGLVETFANPGGNATGLSDFAPEVSGKQLELIKAVVPLASRVTVLHNPANAATNPALDKAREAAQALAVELQFLEIRQPGELESAFSALTAWHAGALLAVSDPVFDSGLSKLSKLAAKSRLPAVYASRRFVEAGGFLAYGPNYADNYRRAAVYVDKILKGAKPADLPVEQPTKFDLVINLKTAKALGLSVPPSLLVRRD